MTDDKFDPDESHFSDEELEAALAGFEKEFADDSVSGDASDTSDADKTADAASAKSDSDANDDTADKASADSGRPMTDDVTGSVADAVNEAMADVATGFRLGETLRIRRNSYTVVGLTRRMVSSSGDPMVFIPLKDAQEAQFLKDNDAIVQNRQRTAANPAFNRPGVPGLLSAIQASQTSSNTVNAVLVRLRPGAHADEVADAVRRWKRLTVYTRAEMEGILIGKLIATSAKQIGMFLVILAAVSAAIVAFIIYTLTMDKIREIAVLKLIGTRNRTIASMILQQALALGLIGFAVGKITATFAAPLFPKYVLLVPQDSLAGLAIVLVICALASVIAIRMALRVDPAEAIGG